MADHANATATTGRSIAILGSRGIPAQHGGFETFAERLAFYLVERGWRVTVYCQGEPRTKLGVDAWQNVDRVHVGPRSPGPLGTIQFDLKSTWRAIRQHPGVVLTLGYNTALFCCLYRLAGISNVINMDGLEWQRSKWSRPARAWLYVNERLGCRLGSALVADHPAIAEHLATRVRRAKILTIPYGADAIVSASFEPVDSLGLTPGGYVLVIARPEPENSILEIVTAFSRKARGKTLVVLGDYDAKANAYHGRIVEAAGPEVRFAGALYEREQVDALRFHAHFYVHGHQVGGTNPSLVEAMGAGCAVLARDNRFNRWVAGHGALYFDNVDECAARLDALIGDQPQLARLRAASRARHREAFTWERVLAAYEDLLGSWHRATTTHRHAPN